MESPCAGKGAILHAATTRLHCTKVMLRRQRLALVRVTGEHEKTVRPLVTRSVEPRERTTYDPQLLPSFKAPPLRKACQFLQPEHPSAGPR